jgi:hypothetical protein
MRNQLGPPFPITPGTGVYAGGEFGPRPRAGRHSMVESDNTSVKLQWTTVVLREPGSNTRTMKDSEEAIFEFVQRQQARNSFPTGKAATSKGQLISLHTLLAPLSILFPNYVT